MPMINQAQIVTAIHTAQTKLVWKPNSAHRHLAKRILRGHLTNGTTLEDYPKGMMNPEERLYAYEVDVQFPDVSGMEHIEMFYNRSELANLEAALSPAQKLRLAKADQTLLRDAQLFYAALEQIVNIKRWREQDNASPSHWWWYLDVLTAAPVAPEAVIEPGPA